MPSKTMLGHGEVRPSQRGRVSPPQAFESTLKSWEDKQKGESYRAATRPRLSSQQSMEYLTEEESSLLQQLSRVTETLIARSAAGRGVCWAHGRGHAKVPAQPRGALAAPAPVTCRIHEAAKAHKAVEQELAHAVNASSLALSEALSHKAAGPSEVSWGWECKAASTQAP